MCSKIRNIVLYDLAHITCPHETMEELLSRLNTAPAFRWDKWRLGKGFGTLWRASLPLRWQWVAEKWQRQQRRQQLLEESERAEGEVIRLEGQAVRRARDSGGARARGGWLDNKPGKFNFDPDSCEARLKRRRLVSRIGGRLWLSNKETVNQRRVEIHRMQQAMTVARQAGNSTCFIFIFGRDKQRA